MHREPDPVGWDHWTNSLNRGYGRGAVMLAFSESQEYTDLTATVPPMAGYLQWYTAPVTFQCGTGNAVVPAVGTSYVDIMVANDSPSSPVGFQLSLDGPRDHFQTAPDTLAPDELAIVWNQPLAGLGLNSVGINGFNNPNLLWAVVLYGFPHSATRAPYTDGLTSAAQFAAS